jgi:SAM-dependent methyltransferase
VKTRTDPAELAYRLTASHYDEFTAHHDYELWLRSLTAALDRLGLAGDRLLDVACGTGKSFLPMLERGWRVTGVDISDEMLDVARDKVAGRVDLHRHDMRALPRLGSFDLVLCLGDSLNYVLEADGLDRALLSMASNLAPTGMLLLDFNTLAMYRGFFASSESVDLGDRRLEWTGHAAEVRPGAEIVATLDVTTSRGDLIARATHRQRHHPPAEIARALHRNGLRCVEVYGQGYDAVLEKPLDEDVHTKAIFIARMR